MSQRIARTVIHGTVTRQRGFPIEWKKHMKELKNKFDMGFNEINHKIDMKVKKDCQVIISPLVQSMSGYRQAIFSAGEYISDWVADVKKGYRDDELVSF
jgi:hypothetical protein